MVVANGYTPIDFERERDGSIVRMPHVRMCLNLEVKVRHCRVTGVSDSGQYLAGLDNVSRVHLQ